MRSKRAPLLVAATVVAAGGIFIAAANFPLTGPAVLSQASLGQVILSVTVVNPAVPDPLAVSNHNNTSGSSGGGGGGGGSGMPTQTNIPALSKPVALAPPLTNTTALPPPTLTPPANVIAVSPVISSASAIPPVAQPVPVLARPLVPGSTGQDVKTLQHFLNTQGFPVTTSGKGSLGQEGTTFGPKTQTALLKFQLAHAKEILGSTGDPKQFKGQLGPKTTAYILKLMHAGQAVKNANTTLKNPAQTLLSKFFGLF